MQTSWSRIRTENPHRPAINIQLLQFRPGWDLNSGSERWEVNRVFKIPVMESMCTAKPSSTHTCFIFAFCL